MKACTAVHLGLAPNVAAVAAHDASHRSQADAGTGKVVCAVQALEDAEQAVGKAHVEAGAVVTHGECVSFPVLALERLQRLAWEDGQSAEQVAQRVLEAVELLARPARF